MVKIGNVEIGVFPLLLAPMEDVSDPPFRSVCKENGADVLYSEFISSEGLIRDAFKSKKKLDFSENERPFGIQIFGGDEEAMALATKIVEVTNPDFIDINFGCPVKKVVCKGAGAGVLKDIPLMVKLTKSVIQSTNKPVTIKTRLGWDEKSINILEVVEKMQDIGVQAITIHARTRSQMYKGEADWSYIARVKENKKIHIPIFGNGDIDSPKKTLEYKNKYGVDGIMIGRASIGYPWIFREIKHFFLTQTILPPPTLQERVEVAKKHLFFSIRWKGESLGILEMRKHYAHYFKNISHFKTYKNNLMQAKDSNHLLEIFETIIAEKEYT
ncbi:MAG: tRNA dihydrouridine synthase DusB [Chitinophagaceae bacterium]|nr:tRNA dihydrouridine synthase DusB [Chitinophagaceae bacterium]